MQMQSSIVVNDVVKKKKNETVKDFVHIYIYIYIYVYFKGTHAKLC